MAAISDEMWRTAVAGEVDEGIGALLLPAAVVPFRRVWKEFAFGRVRVVDITTVDLAESDLTSRSGAGIEGRVDVGGALGVDAEQVLEEVVVDLALGELDAGSRRLLARLHPVRIELIGQHPADVSKLSGSPVGHCAVDEEAFGPLESFDGGVRPDLRECPDDFATGTGTEQPIAECAGEVRKERREDLAGDAFAWGDRQAERAVHRDVSL
ncbi:hypothetical protein L3i23_12730 [Herbiconiux sp. L3-i23]|nr:hypothetical protein L3i23_12730 [Herbiconiux sp. L3-i23]